MTEVTRSSSAMVREPTAIHSAANDECSSMHSSNEHEKMPDLSETKLRKSRAANNRSPTTAGDLHKNNNSSEDEESSHEEESASEVSSFSGLKCNFYHTTTTRVSHGFLHLLEEV